MNECEYLYLRWIGEPRELQLRLVIEEAGDFGRVSKTHTDEPAIQALFAGATAIESNESCRLFEVIYDYPVSYTVVNETYGKYPKEPEKFEGKFFRIFSWSYLLELTKKTSYAADDHPGPGPLQHHSIACLNHVIEVITTKEPEMRILRRPEPPVVH
ncbi:hypothetical protein [Terriglobus saanensis]|nr:hypothetical protein [Terriglobus saanensis]